jgi:Ser/Thr protein kinase RdoA (MazF antagonist)
VNAIDNEKRRAMVESVIDAFEERIIRTGLSQQFRKGILHGDYNDANILIDQDFNVSGVIDFGDSVER